MNLHIYHDAAGHHYPELDNREVSAGLLAIYLGCSRETVWRRANAGEFGRTLAVGAEFRRKTGRKGQWIFRPSVLWRTKQWGRYVQVGFRALDLEGKVRLFHCDPAITAKREQPQAQIPAEFAELTRQMAGCNLGLMGLLRRIGGVANDPIAFPQEQTR